MALFIATFSLIFLAAIVAWRFGEQPEKAGAATMLAMLFASLLGHQLASYQYHKIDLLNALLDALGFCGFFVIALFARRVWPIWVSSLQLIAVMAHVVRVMDIHIHPIAYAMMNWAPSDMIPMILIFGATNRWRLKRKGVSLPPWRNWSGQ